MYTSTLSKKDLHQMRSLGITEGQVISQLDAFPRASPYLRLKRPCTIGDGIHIISEGELAALSELHREAAKQGRCLKFVPASGAATRMFRLPLWFYTREPRMSRDEIARRAEAGEAKFKDLLAVIDSIDHFAFFDDLREVMANAGLDIHALVERGTSGKIFEYLLTPRGLRYANLPKGMLKFHQYPDASRTAF